MDTELYRRDDGSIDLAAMWYDTTLGFPFPNEQVRQNSLNLLNSMRTSDEGQARLVLNLVSAMTGNAVRIIKLEQQLEQMIDMAVGDRAEEGM